MSLIEIRNLRKEYPDVTPLEDVSVNIEAGEVVSIIGPSGTGKSTLLRCINRLETPTSGQILVDGIDVCAPETDLSAVRQKMGMVFQSFNLFPHKMVAENIMLPQQTLLGRSAKEAYEEALIQLQKVGLESKGRKYPGELSGGQKQRVAIARALAMHPKIMLFDEPTSALDPAMVSEVLSVMRDLAGSGLTMLIVTHDMRLARELSDRILYMDQGGIYEQGTPAQIFGDPQGLLTRNFIFRIKSWEYEFTYESQDFVEMLGSLNEFCRRQFMDRRAAGDCELAVEELVTSHLLPIMAQQPKAPVRLTLNAGEEGRNMQMVVDQRELLAEAGGNTEPAEKTGSTDGSTSADAGSTDGISEAILEHVTRQIPDLQPGVSLYQIRER